MYGAVRTCVTWRFRTENSVGESETKRAPTYLLNIHIQPTYAAYFTHTPALRAESYMEGDSRQTKG